MAVKSIPVSGKVTVDISEEDKEFRAGIDVKVSIILNNHTIKLFTRR